MSIGLVTGTSKGLGHELAKQYLNSGDTVVGISRHDTIIESNSYHHLTGDVTSNKIEQDLVQFLNSLKIDRVDVLINNAGTGSLGNHLSELEPDEILHQINLHCVGALRVTKALQSYFNNSKIVNVTSRFASVEQNKRGDFSDKACSYSYKITKCAQNMLSLCMSDDSELLDETIISVNPGQLQTDSGSAGALHSAKEGAIAFKDLVSRVNKNGIYHAFGDEALY